MGPVPGRGSGWCWAQTQEVGCLSEMALHLAQLLKTLRRCSQPTAIALGEEALHQPPSLPPAMDAGEQGKGVSTL